jgi:hypothetical protein
MMVDRISSGTYCARMDIMDGQNTPTHTSNRQNASSCTMPLVVMPAKSETSSWVCTEDWLWFGRRSAAGYCSSKRDEAVIQRRASAPGASLLRLSVSSLVVRWYRTGTNSAAADTTNTHCMYFSGFNLLSEQDNLLSNKHIVEIRYGVVAKLSEMAHTLQRTGKALESSRILA